MFINYINAYDNSLTDVKFTKKYLAGITIFLGCSPGPNTLISLHNTKFSLKI